MSTDNQKYSILNQTVAIAEYAARRGFAVVRTYADEGRSGLRIERRDALKQLIADVQGGRSDYEAILVYDVSRWGRFQDADESGYYEFLCKVAGIQIVYCTEQFENDGSVSSTVLKSIKRAMAGEYSRELSNKVFMGQCRAVRMGFWRGGPAPFGFRRQLIDEYGRPRMQMEYHQRKVLQTDRVVLVPGPKAETETVRRVFEAYVLQGKSITAIASELNDGPIKTTRGMHWTSAAINIMLANETYLGRIVYNRTSFKLQQSQIKNPPEMWIRHDEAVAPTVSSTLFQKAQELRARQKKKMTDQDALERLSKLWRHTGDLSREIIANADGVPSPTTYVSRFGSLANAYKLIGFEPHPRLQISLSKEKVRTLMDTIVKTISANAAAAYNDQTRILMTDKGLVISLRIAWNYQYGGRRELRWYIRGGAYAKPVIDLGSTLMLLAKMKLGNREVEGYYLIPTARLAFSKDRRFRFSRGVFRDSPSYNSIEQLCMVLASAK